MGLLGERTLIISYGYSEEREENGPSTRIGDGVNDILDLRRNVDVSILGIGQRRGEAGCVGVHGRQSVPVAIPRVSFVVVLEETLAQQRGTFTAELAGSTLEQRR